MRFLLVLTVMFATSGTAPLQDTGVSSTGVSVIAPSPANGTDIELPVSLERIREMLLQPAPLQQSLLKRPTFKIEVEERRHIQDLLATLDFKSKSSPPPAGGLYGYETQRVMMSSLSSPVQPYAAFSGGELLTLAFEGILAKYLGWRAMNAISAADRSRAEKAARGEVSRAIVEYCAGLPEKGAGVRICAEPKAP